MMMKMYFHFRIGEPVLFREWLPANVTGYVFTCIAVGAIALAFELLRFAHTILLKKYFVEDDEDEMDNSCCMPSELSRPKPQLPFSLKYLSKPYNLLSPILYFFEMYGSYSLMMISMTYNVPIVASMIAGHVLGYYLTGTKMPIAQNVEMTDCCG